MQIHELPDVTSIGSGGYFATDNGSQTTKIDYDALAKAIIENYNKSTLAGTAQSVKSALDGINNKETWYTIPAANTQEEMLAAVDGWLDATGASHLSGYLNGGRATTFGLPVSTSWYLDMYSNSANFRGIVAHSASPTNQATFVLLKENGEWHTTWIRIASNDANSMHFGTEGNLWASSARLTASTDINQILTGEWFWSDATNRPSTNIPDNNAVRGRLWALDAGGGSYYCAQICYTSSFKWFIRYCTSRSSFTWTEWVQVPTRAEIDALSSKVVTSDTAGYHNGIYRGKDITSYLTDGSLWDRIKGTNGYGLFEDLYLGDYITVGSNSYAIVDFDYYIRCGSADINVHHIVMMPTGNMNIPAGTVLYGSTDTLTFINTANAGVTVSSQETATAFKWNATMEAPNTNTTAGGYKYSRMRQVIMKAADTIVTNAFGSAHVKSITPLYPNPASATASGLASNWAWFTDTSWTSDTRMSICDLPNETQVYGQQVWGRGSAYTNVAYEIGMDKFQFAIFALQRNFADTRATWWLRSVNSASDAAYVSNTGNVSCYGTSGAFGVRPRFLLVG